MLYQWILSIKQSNLLSNFFFFFFKATGKGRLDGWAYRTEQQIWTWGNREKIWLGVL